MATVRFPAVMKYYVNNQTEFSVSASTVKEVVDRVIEQYPSIKFHLVDSEGILRKHFNVFVNGTHIRDLNGMDTRLKEEDKVILMASAAGGGIPRSRRTPGQV
jgi:molybdopterin converting factor small subunit